MLVGVGGKGAANEHAALCEQKGSSLAGTRCNGEALLNEPVDRIHIRLTSEGPASEGNDAGGTTREHPEALSPLRVATRDGDCLGICGECLIPMEGGLVISPHLLVAVQQLLVARGERERLLVELHGSWCGESAPRHAAGRDQGPEGPKPDLFAARRI